MSAQGSTVSNRIATKYHVVGGSRPNWRKTSTSVSMASVAGRKSVQQLEREEWEGAVGSRLL